MPAHILGQLSDRVGICFGFFLVTHSFNGVIPLVADVSDIFLAIQLDVLLCLFSIILTSYVM